MTVISEPVAHIAGADDRTAFEFSSPILRENDAGTGTVTRAPVHLVAEEGVLTTPDLDPGPATVRIGQIAYQIEIPDSVTAVRLWPLIEAGLPVPPEEEAAAVRNGGGIARAQRITESAYAALATPDPETLYLVVEG